MKWITAVGLVLTLTLGSMSPVEADSQTGDVQLEIRRRNVAPGWTTVVGDFACGPDASLLVWTEKYSDGTSQTWQYDPTEWSDAFGNFIVIEAEPNVPPGPLTLVLECLKGSPAEIIGQVTIDLLVIIPFIDVPQGAFYAESVTWARLLDVTTGTSATTFSPDDGVTRWQMALFLNRLFGLGADNSWPSVDTFSDTGHLSDDFRRAIGWLAASGITTGVGDNRFDPDGVVTRWQMAVFLNRFAGYVGADNTWPSLDTFTDTGHLSDDFRRAIGWLAATEITTGVGPGLFDPDGAVTRGQMVTFLRRLILHLVA